MDPNFSPTNLPPRHDGAGVSKPPTVTLLGAGVDATLIPLDPGVFPDPNSAARRRGAGIEPNPFGSVLTMEGPFLREVLNRLLRKFAPSRSISAVAAAARCFFSAASFSFASCSFVF